MGTIGNRKHNACKSCYLSLAYKHCPSSVAASVINEQPGRKNGDAKFILFLSDKPSSIDIRVRKPFEGRTNGIITQYINDYDLTHWATKDHMIKCYCIEPTSEYAGNCIKILIESFKKHRPTIIVPIGSFVYKTLMDLEHVNMKRVVNKVSSFGGVLMIPIYSPAYIKKENAYNEYDKSFNLISRVFSDMCRDYRIAKTF